MAIQNGLISYSGKLGNTIGYQRGKNNYSRTLPKGYNLSEDSINSSIEFGHGSTACVLAKTAFAPLILRPFRKTLHNRLSEIFRKVIRSGPSSQKGKRNVFDGNLALLRGFEFSDKVKLDDICKPLPKAQLCDGEIRLDFPAFDWNNLLRVPNNAEKALIGIGIGFFDFKNYTYELKLAPQLSISKKDTFNGGNLKVNLPLAEEQAVLIMMNIFFEDSITKPAFKIDNQLYQAGAFLESLHLHKGQLVTFEPEEPLIPDKKEDFVPNISWNFNQM